MECLLDDAGIFIGLITLPIQHEMTFYKNEIEEGIFGTYKKAVRGNFEKIKDKRFLKEYDECFYLPKPYYLFGRYDMAILSLIDDFEFCSRTFHSFDPMTSSAGKKPYLENFKHQVITGPTPKFSEKESVVDMARQTFLHKKNFHLFEGF